MDLAPPDTPPDLAALRQRVRSALELVADPAVELYKHARPEAMGAAAASELRRRYLALLRHCWDLLRRAYGVRRGGFYAVHHVGDPLNCLVLTPRGDQAELVARWWAGSRPVTVTAVSSAAPCPEAWVAMGVALHWERPAWLV